MFCNLLHKQAIAKRLTSRKDARQDQTLRLKSQKTGRQTFSLRFSGPVPQLPPNPNYPPGSLHEPSAAVLRCSTARQGAHMMYVIKGVNNDTNAYTAHVQIKFFSDSVSLFFHKVGLYFLSIRKAFYENPK